MHLEDDGIEKRLRCKRRRQISRVYAAHNTATQTLELVNIVGSLLSILCKQNLHISQFLRKIGFLLHLPASRTYTIQVCDPWTWIAYLYCVCSGCREVQQKANFCPRTPTSLESYDVAVRPLAACGSLPTRSSAHAKLKFPSPTIRVDIQRESNLKEGDSGIEI